LSEAREIREAAALNGFYYREGAENGGGGQLKVREMVPPTPAKESRSMELRHICGATQQEKRK
jgi:hypothetical protein